MSIASPRTLLTSIVIFLAVCVSVAFATESQPASASVSARHGDEIFHQRCATCHNQAPGDALPFGPPNLYTVFRQRTISSQQAETIILDGKGSMPPFRSVLSKGDIRCVIAYLKGR